MNRNLVGSIKERSSIDDYPFHPDPLINMTPQTILVSDWSKKIFSKTAMPIMPKLDRKHLWKAFYKDNSFHPELFINMATTANHCF
jgi:hypothetical protein